MDPFWRYRSGGLLIFFCLVLPWAASGQDRFALVIGNSQYDKGRLRNPGSDADSLADVLTAAELGFRVTKRKDLNKEGLEEAVRDFYRSLTRECVALFFYAGHGLQVNGENYLVPVRTAVEEEFEVSNKCYPVSQVLAALDTSPSGLKIIILDCCRDNPYQRSWQRSSGGTGLAAIGTAPEGTLIAFSTAPGKVAADGTGTNSPYTRHLCEVLKSRPAEGLELLDVFRRVGREVNRDTDKTQYPWTNNAVYEKFYFVRRASPASSVTPLAGASTSDVRPSVPRPTPPPVERAITNSIGMQLVRIEAGAFLMGSPESEEDRNSDEGPRHRVRITRPFYLGAHEVTQGQYEAVMGSNPSHFKGTNRPVENVSWDAAVEFCEKLSAREGRRYRLPTEAEWEYACRAGTKTVYSFGDDASELDDYAWFNSNADETHDVGQKQPNGWGLYDMHGNVWEWCSDWYEADYYAQSPMDDPTGPATGSSRVFRGGCWDYVPSRCRSALRNWLTPVGRNFILGFRPALVAE